MSCEKKFLIFVESNKYLSVYVGKFYKHLTAAYLFQKKQGSPCGNPIGEKRVLYQ